MAAKPEKRSARKSYQNDVGFIARNVKFDTPSVGAVATIACGTLPAGCFITSIAVRVKPAFNAASSNTLQVGVTGEGNKYAELTGTPIPVGTTIFEDYIGEVLTQDTPVWVRYAQTGTAASTGEADVVITYVPAIK